MKFWREEVFFLPRHAPENDSMTLIDLGLLVILGFVLSLPFFVKRIEDELEIFLFFMGCVAVTITSQWSLHLIQEALVEPVKITLAVFLAGIIFKAVQKPLAKYIVKTAQRIGAKAFVFLVIVVLGFLSSVITAIIASLVLVEVIRCLNIERKIEIRLVILACFSIGFGAALTPIGEPLSTIAIAKLKHEPYGADFFFLARQLGGYIVPGVILFGLIGWFISPARCQKDPNIFAERLEGMKDIVLRTAKIYLFVMALVFLGSGFKPIVDDFVSKISYRGLYWVNILSAVLDNATLAAAEIGPSLNILQIKSALLGLLISGGMMIPGNIPNIISAGKLKIKSSEWAKFGVPVGLVAMTVCFFFLK